MANRLVNETHEIDTFFYAPPFVIDVRQAEENGGGVEDYHPASGSESPAPELPGTGGASIILPPTSYSIVNQTVRIAKDGGSVVDVTFEFPDAPGIQLIDVRIAKVTEE